MEAIEQNPVIYELMTTAIPGEQTPIVLDKWIPKYVLNRYGRADDELVKSLADASARTVYNGKEIRDGAESIITGRPTLDSDYHLDAYQTQLSACRSAPRMGFIRKGIRKRHAY